MNTAGWILTAFTGLFLLWDGASKVLGLRFALEATAELGLQAPTTRAIGIVLVVCTLLYLLPQTSILGAVLLTGFLGGTAAIHLAHGNPLGSHVLFGVYVGVMAWAGLFLRLPALRELMPLIR